VKLCVKKIYCPECQRLVRGHEETINGRIRILCGRCGRTLWLQDGTSWRYADKHITQRQSLVRSHREEKGNEATDIASA